MEIEVKKLIAAGKYTGNFDFEYTPGKDASIVPLCNVDGLVRVNFTVEYKLSGQCSYCLEPA